jgi:hypothetical protein
MHCAVPLWFFRGDAWDDTKPVILPEIIRRVFSCGRRSRSSLQLAPRASAQLLPMAIIEKRKPSTASPRAFHLRTAAVALPIAPGAV